MSEIGPVVSVSSAVILSLVSGAPKEGVSGGLLCAQLPLTSPDETMSNPEAILRIPLHTNKISFFLYPNILLVFTLNLRKCRRVAATIS